MRVRAAVAVISNHFASSLEHWLRMIKKGKGKERERGEGEEEGEGGARITLPSECLKLEGVTQTYLEPHSKRSSSVYCSASWPFMPSGFVAFTSSR